MVGGGAAIDVTACSQEKAGTIAVGGVAHQGVVQLRLVGGGIYTHLQELLLQVGVPIVLNLIVSPLGQVRGNG